MCLKHSAICIIGTLLSLAAVPPSLGNVEGLLSASPEGRIEARTLQGCPFCKREGESLVMPRLLGQGGSRWFFAESPDQPPLGFKTPRLSATISSPLESIAVVQLGPKQKSVALSIDGSVAGITLLSLTNGAALIKNDGRVEHLFVSENPAERMHGVSSRIAGLTASPERVLFVCHGAPVSTSFCMPREPERR